MGLFLSLKAGIVLGLSTLKLHNMAAPPLSQAPLAAKGVWDPEIITAVKSKAAVLCQIVLGLLLEI